MITETRLTVEFVLDLISLDMHAVDRIEKEDRNPQKGRLSNQNDNYYLPQWQRLFGR